MWQIHTNHMTPKLLVLHVTWKMKDFQKYGVKQKLKKKGCMKIL